MLEKSIGIRLCDVNVMSTENNPKLVFQQIHANFHYKMDLPPPKKKPQAKPTG